MEGVDARAVQDLLAAGGARRKNNRDREIPGRAGNDGSNVMADLIGHLFRFSYRGEEDHFADGHRGLVMLFLVAEGAGHAAAAARDHMKLGGGQQGAED